MSLKETLRRWFGRGDDVLPPVTERSPVSHVASQLPHWGEFLARKYGITLAPDDFALPLSRFVERHGLPPAQILFMEAQLAASPSVFQLLGPAEARDRLRDLPDLAVLDARESWELSFGTLPRARPLSDSVALEIRDEWARERPVLVYCHFGIRSTDTAYWLAGEGFQEIYVLRGGIDAWAAEIDPTIPRYEGAWC